MGSMVSAVTSSLDLPFSVLLELWGSGREPVQRPFSLWLPPFLVGLESLNAACMQPAHSLHSLCSFSGPRAMQRGRDAFQLENICENANTESQCLPCSPFSSTCRENHQAENHFLETLRCMLGGWCRGGRFAYAHCRRLDHWPRGDDQGAEWRQLCKPQGGIFIALVCWACLKAKVSHCCHWLLSFVVLSVLH